MNMGLFEKIFLNAGMYGKLRKIEEIVAQIAPFYGMNRDDLLEKLVHGKWEKTPNDCIEKLPLKGQQRYVALETVPDDISVTFQQEVATVSREAMTPQPSTHIVVMVMTPEQAKVMKRVKRGDFFPILFLEPDGPYKLPDCCMPVCDEYSALLNMSMTAEHLSTVYPGLVKAVKLL